MPESASARCFIRLRGRRRDCWPSKEAYQPRAAEQGKNIHGLFMRPGPERRRLEGIQTDTGFLLLSLSLPRGEVAGGPCAYTRGDVWSFNSCWGLAGGVTPPVGIWSAPLPTAPLPLPLHREPNSCATTDREERAELAGQTTPSAPWHRTPGRRGCEPDTSAGGAGASRCPRGSLGLWSEEGLGSVPMPPALRWSRDQGTLAHTVMPHMRWRCRPGAEPMTPARLRELRRVTARYQPLCEPLHGT